MLETYTWFHGAMLLCAVVFEVTANIFLKLSEGFKRRGYGVLSIALVLAAFSCLYLSLEGISLTLAYASWGGLGILATALVGWWMFGQRIQLAGWAGIALLVGGLLMMKFA